MPSPNARLINRSGFYVYQEALTLEQIAIFEYFIDITRFAHGGVFRIKGGTIERELRLGRRKTETVLQWMETIGLIVPRPIKKFEAKTYFFDFQLLIKNPKLIFTNGIPGTPEYTFLLNRSIDDKRIQIFKTHERT